MQCDTGYEKRCDRQFGRGEGGSYCVMEARSAQEGTIRSSVRLAIAISISSRPRTFQKLAGCKTEG